MAQQVALEAAFQLPSLRGVPAWGNSLPPGHAGRGWEMEKLRLEMVSLVSVPRVPGPKEGSGQAGTWKPVGHSHSALSPFLPMWRRLQTDWLYSWTRWGRLCRPPGTRSHGG